MNISLKPVDRSDYQAVMALKVSKDQEGFVAPNIVSLVQAAYEPDMYPLAIYADGRPAGFFLYDFDLELHGWSMSRFMIDGTLQRRGIGREALRLFLQWFQDEHPEAENLYTSAEVDNTTALSLYESFGFIRGEAFEYDIDDMHFTEYRLRRPLGRSFPAEFAAEATFEPARAGDAERVFRLIDDRIAWMDRAGIRQWNMGDYWDIFPQAYYRKAIDDMRLYVLRSGKNGEIVCAGALFLSDRCWEDDGAAVYLHNFASALDAKGAGDAYLMRAEAYARQIGRRYLRLDCAADNARLNAYYEARGYRAVGRVSQGPYTGILREKAV